MQRKRVAFHRQIAANLASGIFLALVGLTENTLGADAEFRSPFPVEKAVAEQAKWAAKRGCDVVIVNSVGMKLALIPPGRMTSGAGVSTHEVRISKPFFVGVMEVSQGQYRLFKPNHRVEKSAPEFHEENRPVANVSWKDSYDFCQWLSALPAERRAGRVYRLPSNAQWEWAARAGAPAPSAKEPTRSLEAFAWFNHTYTPNPSTERQGRGRQRVGVLAPNAWGLYDTLGNVWEWTADAPHDAATGESRYPLVRGGSWRSGGAHCTYFAHDPADPNTRADHIGFRVVVQLD